MLFRSLFCSLMPKYIKILLPKPFDKPFDYMVEDDVQIELGAFVAVPFGKNQLRGVVWDLSPPEIELRKIKPIVKVETHIAPMRKELRDFVDWVAKYSCFPKGSVMAMCMSVPDIFKVSAPKIGVVLGDSGSLAELKMTKTRKKLVEFVEQNPHKMIAEIEEIGRAS